MIVGGFLSHKYRMRHFLPRPHWNAFFPPGCISFNAKRTGNRELVIHSDGFFFTLKIQILTENENINFAPRILRCNFIEGVNGVNRLATKGVKN